MPRYKIQNDERVIAFAEVAQRYCRLIDSHQAIPQRQFTRECAIVLARRYSEAVRLFDVHVEETYRYCDLDRMSHEEWKTIFESLRNKLGEGDRYWAVYDPYTEEAPTGRTLSDDLADVHRDLGSASQVYGRSERDSQEAVWSWRFHFRIHWGHHCSSALRAIHALLEPFEWEDEETSADTNED